MGFFHLHRTSSSRSSSSAFSSTSSHSTPWTSTDSADDYMTATLKPNVMAPRAPLLNLPFEILQQIASYLDDASAAKFSLSNRQICYTIGTQRLAAYIASSASRFDARDRLEETIERALPGAWHCAWCDKFHLWSAKDGPASDFQTSATPCAEYNSSLTDNMGYTLRYSHLRLALSAHHHGPAHGLALSSLTHTSTSSITLFSTPIQTSISHVPKILSSHLLLHTSYSFLLPLWAAQHRNLLSSLLPLLPPLLTHHRASPNAHTALLAALDNVIRRGWTLPGAQPCDECATEWSVSAYPVPRSVAGKFLRVNIQTWRDLGRGGSPFDAEWRAHGIFFPGVRGRHACARTDTKEGERQSVRMLFESLEPLSAAQCVGQIEHEHEHAYSEASTTTTTTTTTANPWDTLAYSWVLDRQKQDLRVHEVEWRAIWKYIERRAGVDAQAEA